MQSEFQACSYNISGEAWNKIQDLRDSRQMQLRKKSPMMNSLSPDYDGEVLDARTEIKPIFCKSLASIGEKCSVKFAKCFTKEDSKQMHHEHLKQLKKYFENMFEGVDLSSCEEEALRKVAEEEQEETNEINDIKTVTNEDDDDDVDGANEEHKSIPAPVVPYVPPAHDADDDDDDVDVEADGGGDKDGLEGSEPEKIEGRESRDHDDDYAADNVSYEDDFRAGEQVSDQKPRPRSADKTNSASMMTSTTASGVIICLSTVFVARLL